MNLWESFEVCLQNLDNVLARCEDTNLVLNWKKCHFLVREGIVLGHKGSESCLDVDKSKVKVTDKLPTSIYVKGVHSFIGHAGLYLQFINNFSQILRPMCSLLDKEVMFEFDSLCLRAFELLKRSLIKSSILIAPYWKYHFNSCVMLVM